MRRVGSSRPLGGGHKPHHGSPGTECCREGMYTPPTCWTAQHRPGITVDPEVFRTKESSPAAVRLWDLRASWSILVLVTGAQLVGISLWCCLGRKERLWGYLFCCIFISGGEPFLLETWDRIKVRGHLRPSRAVEVQFSGQDWSWNVGLPDSHGVCWKG